MLRLHLAGPAHQQLDDVVLAGGERHLDVATEHPSGGGVDAEVPDRGRGRVPGGAATEQGMDPGDEHRDRRTAW